MSQSPVQRRNMDFQKLISHGRYEVDLTNGNPSDFHVTFKAPDGCPYEGGIYKIHVTIPDNYPFASPSIGFATRIYHPNIDERSGSVCLDVISATWTPMYSLINIFDVFLPQLLQYPNAADPLNPDAGRLYEANRAEYEKRVREYTQLYATPQLCATAVAPGADEMSPLPTPMGSEASSLDMSE